MYRGDAPPVSRCELCNKPFDKLSALKRHGYYCRSRKAANSTTRSRSCISCAKGKARCDNKRPNCSRCMTKAIECHYPSKRPKDTGPRIGNSHVAPTQSLKTAPVLTADFSTVENQQESSNNGDISFDSTLAVPELEVADTGENYLPWDFPDIDIDNLLSPQTIDKSFPDLPTDFSSLYRPWAPSIDQALQVQQNISPFELSIPNAPTSTIRSLIQRPKVKTGAPRRIANLILHNLKSYPRMMLHHNNLPPFVHPRWVSSELDNDHMEPLSNCISLVHMISSGGRASRKLFWKNVGQECERLCAEYQNLSKWELLAAMQALTIYLIIRLDEGETDYNNFDYLLVAAVTVIAQQLASTHIPNNSQSALYEYGLEPSWRDWIYEESKRRLCVVYRVVNMLVYFEPAAKCDLQTDLIIAPLPAKKQLWEGGDEFAWKMENERDPEVHTDFALAADGELVKIDEGQLYCGDEVLLYKSLDAKTPSRSTENWEEWCSGMDGLGGLVMLAASLVG